MLFTGMLLMFANMSIEPIITVYVAQLVEPPRVTFVAGLIMSADGAGQHPVGVAPRQARRSRRPLERHHRLPRGLGRAAHPAGFRDGGLAADRAALPDGPVARRPAALRRQRHPAQCSRRASSGSMLGYSTSSQYVGQVVGPARRRLHRRPYRHARGVPRHLRDHGGGRRLEFCHADEIAGQIGIVSRARRTASSSP